MILEIKASKITLVIDIPPEYIQDLENFLPFRSRANIWKEELYFSIPTELRNLGKPVRSYECGKVYYWPPGKALCIFYGISEPYSEVYYVGEYIGPLRYVPLVSNGEELIISEHTVAEEYSNVVKLLTKLGYKAATPRILNDIEVVASKYVENLRIATTLSIEDYGIYIETEPLYKYSNDYVTRAASTIAKKLIKERFTSVRLDLTEDGYVCISGIAKDFGELRIVLREIEQAYRLVIDSVILGFLGMPRARSIHSI